MNQQPLVSIFVVCYNAAEYIQETLESIRKQTYKNIELVVSDDGSKDQTVRIVQKWIEENKSRFVRVSVLSVENNTGIPANYNRAIKECRGIWTKNVDGDDLLYEDCIERNIEFVENNPNAEWVFSNVMDFSGSITNILGEHLSDERKSFFRLDVEEQFQSLLVANILPSQSCFIKTDLLKKHPYNERYKCLEDEPMWIKLSKNGYKAYFFDRCTAYYRKGESTIYSSIRYFSPLYAESMFLFFWNEKYDYIKQLNLNDAYNVNRKTLLRLEFCDIVLKNKKTKFHNLLYRLFNSLFLSRINYKL